VIWTLINYRPIFFRSLKTNNLMISIHLDFHISWIQMMKKSYMMKFRKTCNICQVQLDEWFCLALIRMRARSSCIQIIPHICAFFLQIFYKTVFFFLNEKLLVLDFEKSPMRCKGESSENQWQLVMDDVLRIMVVTFELIQNCTHISEIIYSIL
jgi:hypothetical protein